MKKILMMVLLFAIATTDAKSKQELPQKDSVIDLVTSTRIVRKLIAANNLADFLENPDIEQLELILNNMSPVQMATEIEIMRCVLPVVAYCYDATMSENQVAFFKQLAQKYTKLKFVTIDIDQLVQLQDVFDITASPTIIIFKAGEEIARISGEENNVFIEQFIAKNI